MEKHKNHEIKACPFYQLLFQKSHVAKAAADFHESCSRQVPGDGVGYTPASPLSVPFASSFSHRFLERLWPTEG